MSTQTYTQPAYTARSFGLQSFGQGATTAAMLVSSLAMGWPGVQPASDWAWRPSTTQGYQNLGALPAAIAAQDNVATPIGYNIMNHASVNQFRLQFPAADIVAVQGIYDLAVQAFQTASRLSVGISVEQEETGPALFLSLDTHGMDFDEQLRHETALRSAIQADGRLAEAKRYLVISVM
ncbi:MAG: hypothetical protein A2486_16170 [Burkholderiales bacterium RIFOXYC12_FULL_65_23]|uniref:hypothetical protein n=1 Tax=Malikia spinosa TaxID=86180 RepID=UPI0008D3A911|nr:MAG: hypothetical protein A2486_16170 [Burkholderiales bacterium RIFOXYC12_FULL_65_23]